MEDVEDVVEDVAGDVVGEIWIRQLRKSMQCLPVAAVERVVARVENVGVDVELDPSIITAVNRLRHVEDAGLVVVGREVVEAA